MRKLPQNPSPNTDKEELREELAAIEHERWADWQKYQHSKMYPELKLLPEDMSSVETGNMVMPKDSYEHWESQIARPYSELSDKEKASDMEQVDRYWPLIEAYIADHDKALVRELLGELPERNPLKVTWKPHRDDVMMYGENKVLDQVSALLRKRLGE